MENNEFGSVFTSDYVFDEAVTLAMVRKNHLKAVEIGESDIQIGAVQSKLLLFQDKTKINSIHKIKAHYEIEQ